MIKNLHYQVTCTLNGLGVNPGVKGYVYIREAVKYCIDDIDRNILITAELYRHIAKKFDTTPTRVERAIRAAIERSFDKGLTEKHIIIFGNIISPEKGKTTNTEFIYGIVEYLNNIAQEESNESRRI